MNADGGGIRRLTKDQNLFALNPRWSPDGSQVAFSGDCAGRDASDICVINVDGTALRAVTEGPGTNRHPTWSPDGTRIAFDRYLDDPEEVAVYSVRADGTGEARLTDGTTLDARPAWSPDGASIAFASDREGTRHIYVMTATGGSPVRLTPSGARYNDPAWSHDGTRIAFTGDGGEKVESPHQRETRERRSRAGIPQTPITEAEDIYVMRADGTNVVRLTGDPSDNISPTWSPDDQQLAFDTDRDGNYEVYVMNTDGSQLRRLTEIGGSDGSPSWSR
jgi:Tol biopolymer transport system component